MPAKGPEKEQTAIRLTPEAMSRLRAAAAAEDRSMAYLVERWAMTLPAVKKGGSK